MTAEVLDGEIRFEVQPVPDGEGALAPPERLSITVRPCWRKPAVQLKLELLYELDGVAYYAIKQS